MGTFSTRDAKSASGGTYRSRDEAKAAPAPILDPARDFLDAVREPASRLAADYRAVSSGKPATSSAGNLIATAMAAVQGATSDQVFGPLSRLIGRTGLPVYDRPAAPWDEDFGKAPRRLYGDERDRVIKDVLNTAAMGVRAANPGVRQVPTRIEDVRVREVPQTTTSAVKATPAQRKVAAVVEKRLGDDPVATASRMDRSLPAYMQGPDDQLTDLAEIAAQSPGPGRKALLEARETYAANAPKRTKADIGQALGGKGDYLDTLDAMIESRKASASAGMAKMELEPVKLDENSVLALRSDLAKGAIRERARNALASPDPDVRAAGVRLERLANDISRGSLDVSTDGVTGKTTFGYQLPDGGQIIGSVNGKNYRIYNAASGAPGQGNGTEAYSDLAARVIRGGGVLQSDVEVSAPAARVYEKLAEHGFTVERNPAAQVMPDGKTEARSWVFRVTDAPPELKAAPDPTISLRDAQDISRALQQQAKSAYASGDGGRGEALATLGKAVRSNAADVQRGGVKGYAEWLKQYGDDVSNEEALQLGMDVFKKGNTAAAIRKQLKDASPAEADMFRKGVGEAVLDQVRQKGDVAALRQLLKNEENAERVSLAFPDDKAFADFMESAAKRVGEQDMNNRVFGGSPTYKRQAARAELEAEGGDIADTLLDVVTLDAKSLSKKAAKAGLKSAPFRRPSIIADPQMNELLGKVLSDPDQLTELLNLMQLSRAQQASRAAVARQAVLPALAANAGPENR